MKATDVRPSRFAEARRAAIQLIDEAGRGAEVMVIEAGVHPVIRVPFTRDVERARAAIQSLEPRDLPNHLSEAVRTALTLVPALDRRVRIHVVTDGAFDPAQVREFPDLRVRWVRATTASTTTRRSCR
jgi:Mg-chelatase subunit ChlD